MRTPIKLWQVLIALAGLILIVLSTSTHAAAKPASREQEFIDHFNLRWIATGQPLLPSDLRPYTPEPLGTAYEVGESPVRPFGVTVPIGDPAQTGYQCDHVSGIPADGQEHCLEAATLRYYGTATETATTTATPTSTTVPTATATSTVTPASGCTIGDFADVRWDSTFYVYIRALICHGVIGGYGDNTYRPGNILTRGQMTKIVVNAAGWELLNPPTATFTDVPVGSTFYTFIETAYAHGVVSGYGNTFRPNNNVTRGQVAKMVALAFFPEGPYDLRAIWLERFEIRSLDPSRMMTMADVNPCDPYEPGCWTITNGSLPFNFHNTTGQAQDGVQGNGTTGFPVIYNGPALVLNLRMPGTP
jgi:hypothetical protein